MEMIDEIDRTILRLLQTDAKKSAKEIANQLNLTVSPPKSYSFAKTICEGEAFAFGGNTYP